jgi:elongation factor P
MTISLSGKLYRVESALKVAAKGAPFIKTKLRDLATDEIVEKSFKPTQQVKEVSVAERNLEFLYLEGKDYRFLDVDELEEVSVPPKVIGDSVNYLKEGIQVKAIFYGEQVFTVELPPFLELAVSKIEEPKKSKVPVANVTKVAILETGAKVEIPPFVEVGDILKVDTRTGEFIQRV